MDVCVLKGSAHLMDVLHGFWTAVWCLEQSHGSYLLLMVFRDLGSVIQVSACVVVTNQTSGLRAELAQQTSDMD